MTKKIHLFLKEYKLTTNFWVKSLPPNQAARRACKDERGPRSCQGAKPHETEGFWMSFVMFWLEN